MFVFIITYNTITTNLQNVPLLFVLQMYKSLERKSCKNEKNN